MSVLFAPTDDIQIGVIQAFGRQANTATNLSRTETCDRKMSVYKNHYAGIVDQALRGIFAADENYLALRLLPHTSTNILERVVLERARAYQEPATRYLKSEGDEGGQRVTATGRIYDLLQLSVDELASSKVGEAPSEAPTNPPPAARGGGHTVGASPPAKQKSPFDRWVEASDLDTLMADVHRLALFNPVVWVAPMVRESDDGGTALTYDVYTPANADVILDPKDTTRAVGFYTWRVEPVEKSRFGVGKKTEYQKFYYLWTKDQHTKHDHDWKRVPYPENPEGTNPLGRLPIVAVRLGRPIDSYYLDGKGDDLFDATIEIAILRTLQNARLRDSSFKQLAIDADPEKMPAGQVMGNPALPIYLGQDATATVLDLQANLEQISSVISERINGIIVKYGISPSSWSMSEKAQSGFSKKMDQASIIKANREDRKYLAAAERELYKLCARLLSVHGVKAIGTLNESAEYVIDFADPKFEEEPLTQAKADALDLKLGKVSIVDVYRRDNGDVTEEEAMRQIALNIGINEKLLSPKQLSLLDLLASDGKSAPQGPPGFAPGGGDDA